MPGDGRDRAGAGKFFLGAWSIAPVKKKKDFENNILNHFIHF
jgi:hypothetical protein